MRVGIVGLGFVGATHARAWQSVAGVRLTAVVSSDAAKLAGELSNVTGDLDRGGERLDFQDARRYSSFPQLIDDDAVDAVDLCTPSYLQADRVAIACAADPFKQQIRRVRQSKRKRMNRIVEPLEVGVVFWTGGDLGEERPPAEIVESVASLGLHCGQLAIHGGADLSDLSRAAWSKALTEKGVTAVTAVVAFTGESYADVATVERTVGYSPAATRDAREHRTYEVCDFAAQLSIPGLATHIGAIPHEVSDPGYALMRDLVRRLCDHCARHQQTFALETGQESAAQLNRFIAEVDRPNLRVNFDPANMVMYGSGDPIEALGAVAESVVTVHCKDGVGPSAPGQLGHETPLGAGEVGMDRFVSKLREIGYQGPLIIEREIVGAAQREDIRQAINLLNRLRQP